MSSGGGPYIDGDLWLSETTPFGVRCSIHIVGRPRAIMKARSLQRDDNASRVDGAIVPRCLHSHAPVPADPCQAAARITVRLLCTRIFLFSCSLFHANLRVLQGRVAQLFFLARITPFTFVALSSGYFLSLFLLLQFIPLLARARSLITLAREST